MEKDGNNSGATEFGINLGVEEVIIGFLETKIKLGL